MDTLAQGARLRMVGIVRVPKCAFVTKNSRFGCKNLAPSSDFRWTLARSTGRSAIVSVASVDAVAEKGENGVSNGASNGGKGVPLNTCFNCGSGCVLCTP